MKLYSFYKLYNSFYNCKTFVFIMQFIIHLGTLFPSPRLPENLLE